MPRRSRRRAWIALLGAMLLVYCGGADDRLPEELAALRQALPPSRGLNVLVVSFDALRADALGVYGYPRRTSPRIDAFATEALLFEQAYAASPVSPTSFASAWTGMLSHRVFHAWELVHPTTLASEMSRAGYRTAAIVNNVHLTPERHFDTGFEHYDFHRNDADEQILEIAIRWLQEVEAEPFFAWVHFLTPHSPYEARDLAADLYDAEYAGPFEDSSGRRFEPQTAADTARVRSLYDGEVRYADALFGRLLEAVQASGLLSRTLLVLTSDHGEEFGEHGRFQHGTVYEPGLRIPLIIRHPRVRRRSRTEVLYSNVDLMPTLLGLVGAERVPVLDGRDLTALTRLPDRIVGVQMTGAEERWISLRHGASKLIVPCLHEGEPEMYDLAVDPEEKHDVAGRSNALLAEMYGEIGVVMGSEDPCAVMIAAMRGQLPTSGLSQESVEALRALGYIQ